MIRGIRGKRGQDHPSPIGTIIVVIIALALLALALILIFDIGGFRSTIFGFIATESSDTITSHCKSYLPPSPNTFVCKIHYLKLATGGAKAITCQSGKNNEDLPNLDVDYPQANIATQCNQYICPLEDKISANKKCTDKDWVKDPLKDQRFYYSGDVITIIPYGQFCCKPPATQTAAITKIGIDALKVYCKDLCNKEDTAKAPLFCNQQITYKSLATDTQSTSIICKNLNKGSQTMADYLGITGTTAIANCNDLVCG